MPQQTSVINSPPSITNSLSSITDSLSSINPTTESTISTTHSIITTHSGDHSWPGGQDTTISTTASPLMSRTTTSGTTRIHSITLLSAFLVLMALFL
jgi:hypothetical protein